MIIAYYIIIFLNHFMVPNPFVLLFFDADYYSIKLSLLPKAKRPSLIGSPFSYFRVIKPITHKINSKILIAKKVWINFLATTSSKLEVSELEKMVTIAIISFTIINRRHSPQENITPFFIPMVIPFIPTIIFVIIVNILMTKLITPIAVILELKFSPQDAKKRKTQTKLPGLLEYL